uniref:Uncharacterized protein n=1 Tax=Anguilla anguilla TaxID=7936 RepID=A0A0E9S476_ANGAN
MSGPPWSYAWLVEVECLSQNLLSLFAAATT